jgi:hypothetical protein
MMFILRQASLSMLEVVAFSQFDMASLLAICAAVYGLRAREAELAQARGAVTKAWIPGGGGAERTGTGTASPRA